MTNLIKKDGSASMPAKCRIIKIINGSEEKKKANTMEEDRKGKSIAMKCKDNNKN